LRLIIVVKKLVLNRQGAKNAKGKPFLNKKAETSPCPQDFLGDLGVFAVNNRGTEMIMALVVNFPI
jgi:hypothetical protein